MDAGEHENDVREVGHPAWYLGLMETRETRETGEILTKIVYLRVNPVGPLNQNYLLKSHHQTIYLRRDKTVSALKVSRLEIM